MNCSARTVLFILVAAAAGSHAASPAEVPFDTVGVKGGLVVCVGCEDPAFLCSLRESASYIVHGLDQDAGKVRSAKAAIHDRRYYGRVSVDTFDGRNLPYIDNLVNLLILAEPETRVSAAEAARVLAPRGVLLSKAAIDVKGTTLAYRRFVPDVWGWRWFVKPWPDALDEWTHYHHNPEGTMVGGDRVVGPPRRIQWMGGPKWLRNHDFMSSMHAMVSSRGRIFYVIDEGLRNHIFLPARWKLVARDGFNGAILWKRHVVDWHPSNWPLKSGPGHLPRRLVAAGDRIYVAGGLKEPVAALDAATGQHIKTYVGTSATQEMILSGETLYCLVDPDRKPVGYRAKTATYKEIRNANNGWAWTPSSAQRKIIAVDAGSGRDLWQHSARVAPLTLTVSDQKVFYHNGAGLVALNRKTGKVLWTSDGPEVKSVVTGGSLRVVYSDGILLFARGVNLSAFSAENGKPLWTDKLFRSSHHCPEDLFVIDGLIWSANTGRPQDKGTHVKALDLRTGEMRKDIVAANLPGFPMHPRCYPSRATNKYIMTNGMGTEFYRVGGKTVDIHNYVRGSCIYGVMPCNGLLYKPPDSCACYYQSKLEHLCALAPASAGEERRVPEDQRLKKGPAYGFMGTPTSVNDAQGDWPMYRRDAERSGCCPATLSSKLKPAWTVNIGWKLTQPVVAEGKVFVGTVTHQTVFAIDADNGKIVWHYTAGGRIDSSPTFYQGLVLFGCADGRVYCLRAADGRLVWSYLAAFGEKRHVAYHKVESVWPVHGSVLVQNGELYALAGRNMFFDGGLRLVRLNPFTGRLISENIMDENDPATGKNLQTLISKKYMPVANADILSSDGERLYMQEQNFDMTGKRLVVAPSAGKRHLFCQTGFLDSAWFHRSFWIYGEDCGEGWGAYANPRNQYPCGRIMALDESRVYAYRSDPLGNMLHPRQTYKLYAADRKPLPQQAKQAAPRRQARNVKGTAKGNAKKNAPKRARGGGYKTHWSVSSLPLLINAMALGGEHLFVAGPPDLADEGKMLGYLPGTFDDINKQLFAQEAAWHGTHGGLLWVVSTETGEKLAEYKLDSIPVFDGMAAARGGLFVSMIDGSVVCYAEE